MRRWMPKPPQALPGRDVILAIRPRILHTTYGKVMAVSPDVAPLHIGVIGETEWVARTRFQGALVDWANDLEREWSPKESRTNA